MPIVVIVGGGQQEIISQLVESVEEIQEETTAVKLLIDRLIVEVQEGEFLDESLYDKANHALVLLCNDSYYPILSGLSVSTLEMIQDRVDAENVDNVYGFFALNSNNNLDASSLLVIGTDHDNKRMVWNIEV